MSQQIHTVTSQQVELVSWTASLGAVTADALAHRLGVSIPSARARLAAAERRKLLARKRPLFERPSLFTATPSGLRACNARGIQTCQVSAAKANHLIVCAAAAAALERSYPDHRIIGEHELRRDEREHGDSLASAQTRASHGGDSDLHRPDLVLWPKVPDDGLPVAVEIELTIKAHRRLAEICRAWARCRKVAGVIYLAPPAVQRAVSRAVAEARAGEQVAVLPLTALPGMAAGVGRELADELQLLQQDGGAQHI